MAQGTVLVLDCLCPVVFQGLSPTGRLGQYGNAPAALGTNAAAASGYSPSSGCGQGGSSSSYGQPVGSNGSSRQAAAPGAFAAAGSSGSSSHLPALQQATAGLPGLGAFGKAGNVGQYGGGSSNSSSLLRPGQQAGGGLRPLLEPPGGAGIGGLGSKTGLELPAMQGGLAQNGRCVE